MINQNVHVTSVMIFIVSLLIIIIVIIIIIIIIIISNFLSVWIIIFK